MSVTVINEAHGPYQGGILPSIPVPLTHQASPRDKDTHDFRPPLPHQDPQRSCQMPAVGFLVIQAQLSRRSLPRHTHAHPPPQTPLITIIDTKKNKIIDQQETACPRSNPAAEPRGTATATILLVGPQSTGPSAGPRQHPGPPQHGRHRGPPRFPGWQRSPISTPRPAAARSCTASSSSP